MGRGRAERIEAAIDKVAAVTFAAAVAFAFLKLLNGTIGQLQLGAYSAGAGAFAYLVCARALRRVGPAVQAFRMAEFDIPPIDETQLEELLLIERVELVLTEADRLQPIEPNASGELVLDDILAELGPDSRVVRLFDPAAMPTPGQLNAKIERHLGEASSQAAPSDASQALYDALNALRRSLR